MSLPMEIEQPENLAQRTSHKGRAVLIVVVALVLLAVIISGGYILNLTHSFDSKTEKIQSAFPEESTRSSGKAL